MPLVLTENEATESGITYADRTGVSYQYPTMYRRIVQAGEQFVYYRGRRRRGGGRAPQVYFGTGVIGEAAPDPEHPARLRCEILDYQAFPVAVSFKDDSDDYFERGGDRKGYFQRGVRAISDDDFKRIVQAARTATSSPAEPAVVAGVDERGVGPRYASPAMLRAVEEFAVRVATNELRRRYPSATVEPQPRNNPGFDVLLRRPDTGGDGPLFVEVKGTTRNFPLFFLTEGELQFSLRHGDHFRLIVVYGISLETGTYSIFWHEGPISRDLGFRLKPVQWACEVSGHLESIVQEAPNVETEA